QVALAASAGASTRLATAVGIANGTMAASAGALKGALMALASPAGALVIATGAMYALVKAQEEAADRAWKQAEAFDAVRASLNSLTIGEVARAVQSEFE